MRIFDPNKIFPKNFLRLPDHPAYSVNNGIFRVYTPTPGLNILIPSVSYLHKYMLI